jgi:twinkle protein
MQAKEISQQLAQRTEDVARLLFPEGTRYGAEWCIGNISGDQGKSLKIHLTGNKAGIWSDFSTGDSGDLLDLWALKRNLSIVEALKECSVYLGLPHNKVESLVPFKFARPKVQTIFSDVETVVGMTYLIKDRKIGQKTINNYKIGIIGDDIVFPYIRDNEIIFVKYIGINRNIEGKKKVRVEPNCEPCLFGWHMIPKHSRTVTICEGEIDAMSLHQFGIPALSVPFGAGIGKKHVWIEHECDRLNAFDVIYICMDSDSAGKIAAKEIIDRLGAHRCRLVTLPFKDANECLQNGINSELMAVFFSEAVSFDPDELQRFDKFQESILLELNPPHGFIAGYYAPWNKTHDKVFFRSNELSLWGGINGHGKSQFIGHLMLSMMRQGALICLASLELKPSKLGMRLIRQATAMQTPSNDYALEVIKHYSDQLWLFNVTTDSKSDRLIDVFKYARQRYGINVFIIDSLMMLGLHDDDYNGQKEIVEKLCHFKNKNNCQIHLVVHPRKGADESNIPTKIDYKGTGTLSDLADNCFTIWRNKAKEKYVRKKADGNILTEKEQQYLEMADVLWFCDKQRHGDWEGAFNLWFDKSSYQYLESPSAKPKPFVEWSCLKK